MELSDKFIRDELSLLEDFENLEDASKNSNFELAKWRRVFYAYELSREILVHSLGLNRYRESIAYELGDKPMGPEYVGRMRLKMLQSAMLSDKPRFSPWHGISHERQVFLVSQFNDDIESVTSKKRLTLHNWAEGLKNCDDSLWDEFTKYLRGAINGEYGSVVLATVLNPEKIGDWENQFKRWKDKEAEKLGNKNARLPKKGSETIKDWTLQLLKLRILRGFEWNEYRAHKHNPLSFIKPDRHDNWIRNAYLVEKKIEQFFNLKMWLLPEGRRK